MKKLNIYKLSTYLIIPCIIFPIIANFYHEWLSSLITAIGATFLSLIFKKLLNEIFNYHKIDRLIYVLIFLLFSDVLKSLVFVFINNSTYSGLTLDLISKIILVLISLVEIFIGKSLIKDNIGYPELFPIYSKTLINSYMYLIILEISVLLFRNFENILYILIPLIIFTFIIFAMTLSAAIRNLIYYFKIFQKAAQEQNLTRIME